MRVTPHKRPSIKEILSHPYFTEEDEASTKESEIEQQSKFNKSMLGMTEQKTPTIHKPQQNSYPFYAPKLNNPPKLDNQYP